MTDLFAGRRALVTGAARGIGRAAALGLAEAGADLMLLARSSDQLEATRSALTERGTTRERVVAIAVDLADESASARSIEAVLARGSIDMLVNNAATGEPLGATAKIPASALRHALELNVIAACPFLPALGTLWPVVAQKAWSTAGYLAGKPGAAVMIHLSPVLT